jgi:glc operon protein GlcG
VLTVTETTRIIEAARAEAEKNKWAVAIVVVDDGGHQLGMLRLDGSAPVGSYIATEKARTAAIGRRETKVYEDMINQGRTAFLSAPLQGTLEGGVPVIVEGQVIGAVGVSGVKPDQDAQVARAGVQAIGA